MARRNKHSLDEIKAMVLSAAEAIVAEGGGSALTVRKIAMRVGYTVGSIYMVFDNMADVIAHLNEQTLEHIFRELSQTQGKDLQALGHAYLGYVNQNHHRWRLFSDVGLGDVRQVSEAYQAKTDAIISLIESRLSGTSDSSQKRRLARTLWAGMQGICTTMLADEPESVKETAASISLLITLFCDK